MYSAIRPVVVTVKKRYRLSNFALIQKYGIVYFRINNAKTKKKMTCSRWKKNAECSIFYESFKWIKKKNAITWQTLHLRLQLCRYFDRNLNNSTWNQVYLFDCAKKEERKNMHETSCARFISFRSISWL